MICYCDAAGAYGQELKLKFADSIKPQFWILQIYLRK